MTLDQAVALSLLENFPGSASPRGSERSRDSSNSCAAARARPRGPRARRASGIHVAGVERPAISRRLIAIDGLSAGALVSRHARLARPAGGGDRRFARRVGRRPRNGGAAGGGPRRARHHGRQRPGARRRFGGASRRASNRPDDRRPRLGPRSHLSRRARPLADEIARTGLVFSEYPPGTPPLPFHFPMRNRLISGLSRAVVVIEASDKSGSLITAACALEQGRDVMAVPGNVLSGRNTGRPCADP